MRKIQRKSLSCTECTRRKLRCSKTIPCSACIDRKIEHRCQRRQPEAANTPAPANDPTRGNVSRQTSRRTLSPTGPSDRRTLEDSTISLPGHSPNGSHAGSNRLVDSVATDAAVTLEFLALGRQRIVHSGRTHPEFYDGLEPDLLDDSVLTEFQVKALMLYHQNNLAWMHNAVHMPTFISQCDGYFAVPGSHERQWLALYYAMLAFSLYHVHPDVLRNLGIEPAADLAEMCYNKSIDSLYNADFMSRHSILSVQSICLLIYVGYNLGQSDKISVLLSCGIRIAQSLCIHRLGPDRTSPAATSKQLIDREVQKRCWWFLVRQDWLQIPFINTYSIHPTQFNTPMPKNCFEDYDRMIVDGLLVEQPKNTYTQTSYTSVLNDVSVLIWKTQDQMCKLGPPQEMNDGLHRLYSQVISADEDLRSIMKKMPIFYQEDCTPQESCPSNIQQQRHILFLALAHKFYSIHRHFQIPSYKDPWFAYSKVSCLPIMRHSLRAVLSLPDDQSTWAVRGLWTVNTQVVTAAVWLLFDLLLSRDDRWSLLDGTEVRELIHKSRDFLDVCREKSHIARRGTALLRILLDIDATYGEQRFNLEDIISRVEASEEEFQSNGAISVLDWLSRGPNNFGEMIEFLDTEQFV